MKIAKKTVKAWLNSYQELTAGDTMLDAVPSNSGPKSYDGVSGRQLNKIMLDAAIKHLPQRLKLCVVMRWVRRRPLGETLQAVGVQKSQYYRLCDLALDTIYREINGITEENDGSIEDGYRKLLAAIEKTVDA